MADSVKFATLVRVSLSVKTSDLIDFNNWRLEANVYGEPHGWSAPNPRRAGFTTAVYFFRPDEAKRVRRWWARRPRR